MRHPALDTAAATLKNRFGRARSAPSKEPDMRETSTPALARSPARKAGRMVAVALGALLLATSGGVQAQPHGGYYHGGYYRGGWGAGPLWGGVGLGIGLGLASGYYYDRPDYVVVDQPPVYYAPAPVYAPPPPPIPVPVAAAPAEPIFYPRSGQSATQAEADRQACNRWATTQPRAMSDASVFQRATFACMDGRGYTAR
jgi:hypothetical protein